VKTWLDSALIVSIALLGGCASAGSTAGIFDSGSVWYKHPVTSDVKECGGGFYPGVQIRRYNCGKRLLAEGYIEVEKCKKAATGTACVTDAEIRTAEATEQGQSPPRAWVLWSQASGSADWTPVSGWETRSSCEEARQKMAYTPLNTLGAMVERSDITLACLPDTVDPRGPKGK
jgi:hypothetical protein